MADLATLAAGHARRIAGSTLADDPVTLEAVNEVFKAMHGAYGKPFLDKFSTGKLDAKGRDEGIKSARMAWAHALRRFSMDVIADALETMRKVHPSWPPTLGEFEALCTMAVPQLQSAQAVAEKLQALPCSGEAFSAATSAAREAFKAQRAAMGLRPKPDPLQPNGIALLCAAVADAVATAGGNEAAELRRLDAVFSAKAGA